METAWEALIPISMFLSIAAIIIVALFLKLQKRKVESQEILAAIEKGVEVKFPDNQRNRLLSGLIWLLTGIVISLGMGLAIPEDAPSGMWVWGLIPVAVGAAYLIVYRLEGPQEENE